jgi:hypothetical protein
LLRSITKSKKCCDPDSDFIPLADRIAYYEREEEALKASASKVVELQKPAGVDDPSRPLDQEQEDPERDDPPPEWTG